MFPYEIIVMILGFIPIKNLMRLIFVSKIFKQIILENKRSDKDLISECLQTYYKKVFKEHNYYSRSVLEVALETRTTEIVKYEIFIKTSKRNFIIDCSTGSAKKACFSN